MAVTPGLDELGSMISERIENKYGFSHYVGADAEGKAIKDTQSDFVVVCGYGRIGKMVCDLLDKKFIPYVAFDVNPSKVRRRRIVERLCLILSTCLTSCLLSPGH